MITDNYAAPPACRHCGAKATKPRRLCWRCYADAAIRERYTQLQRQQRREGRGRKPLPQPTDALPGTEAKMRVLEERRAAGQELWHPLDPGTRDMAEAVGSGRSTRTASVRRAYRAG
jgi:hypothetical protein